MSSQLKNFDRDKKPKLILVDDDPMFGAMMLKQAEKMGVSLDFYDSLSSLGFISQLAEYDIIIVDYQMDHINGIEIAAYMPSFFDDKTVILISSTEVEKQVAKIPDYITCFIHKDSGNKAILDQAILAFDSKNRKAS